MMRHALAVTSLVALAALLDLSVAGLADPLEVLSAAGLVGLGMWRAWPAHPLLADAVLASMPPSGRSALHRRAADHLARTRRPRQAIAAQLLHTLPGEDPEVVDVLRAAAAESLAAGAPAVAARQLLRAVGETRPEDTDPTLVAQAAAAHRTAGLREQALHLWRQAQDRAVSPDQRAGWLTDMGDVQLTLGDHDAARASYRSALRMLGDAGHDRSSPHIRRVHARAGLARAWYDGLAVDLTGMLTEANARPPAEDIHADRLLFGLAACQLALHGEDRDCARALALRALGDGALLREETADGPGFLAAAAVLTWADSYEEAMRVLDAAVDDSHARGSTLGLSVAWTGLGLVHLRQGRLGEALTCFDLALQRREEGWESYGGPALAGTVVGLLSAGRIQEACALEHDLRRLSPSGGSGGAQPAAAAGLVRATSGDHEQALEDYRRAATLMGGLPDNASVVAWRELSVWSLLALGRRAEAEEMAAEALAHARRWGAPRALGFALRTRARVLAPEDAEAHLREAIDLLRPAGIVELTARAEVDLGRLLLPDGPRRAEAVRLLRAGAERARTVGAQPVARRAARLLARLGVRLDPDGESPLAALTRGERRVVELAASGLTNREIAQRLVVTVKAVEWHLSNAYRKLAVTSRVQLAGVLYGSSSSDR
jgi:tetratricopeptide (TPR) repeat protein/DNA-binding CsgD family transcriptional regulator